MYLVDGRRKATTGRVREGSLMMDAPGGPWRSTPGNWTTEFHVVLEQRFASSQHAREAAFRVERLVNDLAVRSAEPRSLDSHERGVLAAGLELPFHQGTADPRLLGLVRRLSLPSCTRRSWPAGIDRLRKAVWLGGHHPGPWSSIPSSRPERRPNFDQHLELVETSWDEASAAR